MGRAIDFFVAHQALIGLTVLIPCVWFKVHIIYNCKSHPLYRGGEGPKLDVVSQLRAKGIK